MTELIVAGIFATAILAPPLLRYRLTRRYELLRGRRTDWRRARHGYYRD